MNLLSILVGLAIVVTGFSVAVSHFGSQYEIGKEEWANGDQEKAKERVDRAAWYATAYTAIGLWLGATVMLWMYQNIEPPAPEPAVRQCRSCVYASL